VSDQETALLAGLMRTPGRIFDAATIAREDLTDPKNWACLEAMRAVVAGGNQIGPERVEVELGRAGYKAADLAPGFVSELAQRASGDVGEHIERVLQASLRRKALAALDRARLELEGDEPGAVDRAVSSLLKAAAPRDGKALATEGEALERAIIEAMSDADSGGLSTGFLGLDRLDVRISPGKVIVLAAPTSIGKSAMASQIVVSVAQEGGRALLGSFEMTRAELLRRMVSQVARIPSEFLASASRERIADAARRVSASGLGIADLCGDSRLETLVSVAQAFKARGGLDLLAIDYLGLIRLAGPRRSQYEAISETTRAIKQLAGSLDCGILLLAQLNRQPSAREDSRPRLSDLRDSGSIEQDADVVLLIHRERGAIDGALIVEKNRSGPKGDVRIMFDGPTCFFSEPDERPKPKPAPKQTEITL